MFQHVTRFVQETPWAVLPAVLDQIIDVVRLRAGGGRLSQAEIEARISASPYHASAVAARKDTAYQTQGDIAVLPVYGVLCQRMGMMDEMSGGTSTERLGQAFQAAIADRAVGMVVLDIDSPGGSVFGIQELGDLIAAGRAQKPVVAVANSMAASAAYWLATQADEIVVTPGGEVGSIGVLAVHEDLSRAAEAAGVKVSYIHAGRYKVEGNPFEPLGEEARAAMQSRVDDYYAMFVRAVAKGRGVTQTSVREGMGEGRVVGAREAIRLGMADKVGTLADTLARYQQPGSMAALRSLAKQREIDAADPRGALERRKRRSEEAAARPVVLPVPQVRKPEPPRTPEPETVPADAPDLWRPR